MRTFSQEQSQPQKQVSSSPARPNMAAPGPALHEHPILHLQRTVGNQAVLRILQTPGDGAEGAGAGLTPAASPRFAHDLSRTPIHPRATGVIQAKLAINKPGDEFEREADRISEQVMRMPEPQLQHACACGGGCPKCKTERPVEKHQRLQTKHIGAGDLGQTEAPPIVHEVLRSPGQPLDPATRAFMEPRFGRDFSQVRVHTEADAAHSADALSARAFTSGTNIAFGKGRYRPETAEGQGLLAHELTHVVQQGRHATTIQRSPGPDKQWSRDENAARYRGQIIAKRIRNHGKLSKEVRAQIDRELDYFEGSAKEVYTAEIKPALLAVTPQKEIEMPGEQEALPPAPAKAEYFDLDISPADPAHPNQTQLTFRPLKERADYIDARMSSIEYGLYLRGFNVYIDGLDTPIFISNAYVEDRAQSASIGDRIYDSIEEANAAVAAYTHPRDAVPRHAYYAGAEGRVIAPTVFSVATAPRIMATLFEARAELARQVQHELGVVAVTMVGGKLLHVAHSQASKAFTGDLPPRPPSSIPSEPRAASPTAGKGTPEPVRSNVPPKQQEPEPATPVQSRPSQHSYVNNNPKATENELKNGVLLDGMAQAGELKGVSRVEGAPEGKVKSGDYRFVKPDGTKLSADLYEPKTNDPNKIVGHIYEKSGQADVAVVKLGEGTSGQVSRAQANTIAQDVLRTPGHGIHRVIVVKDGNIILDLSR